MRRGIIGNGGFGREVFYSMSKEEQLKTVFFVEDDFYVKGQFKTLPLSEFNTDDYEVIIAIADSKVREKIVKKLPQETKYFTYIHHSVQLYSDNIEIGIGSIICPGCILTTNIKIGNHCQLDRNTQIGHDCLIGNYFRTSPSAIISGNCKIGDHVYMGTNSSVREKINICNNVIIGLNSGVVKDINEKGTYAGLPVKKIK
jgi:sugar O-acyltransferase (sialic acid O-acetyltransferase NeuD family)